MFLKKSLLFMTALALLMFTGQASAQLSLSLSEGGSTMVSGAGTEISVDVSQMGVDASVNAVEIVFDIDMAVVTLTGGPDGFIITGGNTASLLNLTPAPVPASASFTFTTAADVTGVEFSIGISSISLDNVALAVPLPAAIAFNGLEAALTTDGEVNDDSEIVIDVAVPGLTAATSGAEITFMVDPAGAAMITGLAPADDVTPDGGLGTPPDGGIDGMSVTLLALPAVNLTDGKYGSVTLTVGEDVTDFTIRVASFMMFTADGMKRSVGGGMPLEVMVGPRPKLETESTEVTFEDFGVPSTVMVTAVNFEEGATIKFSYEATADFQAMEDGSSLTITAESAGDVMVTATDGTVSASVTITFMNPDPYVKASESDVIIPEGGMKSVTVSAVGLEGVISYTIKKTSGTASISSDADGDMVTLTGSGMGSAMVEVTASAGGVTTETISILFRAMPTVGSDPADVEVPQTVVGSGMAMVVATGFPEGAEITFNVEVTSGLASYLDDPDEDGTPGAQDGNVLTLTSTGTVSVSVTASGAGVTTSAVAVSFTQTLPAKPASVKVQDNPGDNGHYVMVSFTHSENHADVSQYRIYRQLSVNTEMVDGELVVTDNPQQKWVPWSVVDAMDNTEGMTRVVVPVTDAMATLWGVAAEKGMKTQDDSRVTPATKRVFSKESVQQLVQFLGMDPNRVVTEDELSKMLMPSADYINSLTGGKKNVVFAALDPDLSVLIGGNLAVPQNIRTGGSGPIVSSPITASDGMAAALDDMAPAAVTDVTADPDTGVITWTASEDDGGMDAVMYRGHAIMIPHVTGYRIMASIPGTEAPPIDVTAVVGGVLPPGSTTLTVPRPLIDSLIDRGVPAVLIDVVVMDGTNMTSIVPPLVVELAPKRKLFVDADGSPVFVVKLDRYGAMTPLLVDFEDFVAFTMAFNKSEATTSREEWRVFIQADLNDDTVVNFDDFILFFGSYGKEATGPAGKSLVTPVLGVNENAEFSLRLGSDRVVVGENMFVDVSLANIQALMGYGFVLHYDAETFEFVEAVPATEDLLASTGGETPLLRGWSPEAGQVHVMNAIVNGSEVSGDGDIVRLVFRVLRDFEDNARFEIADGLVFDPSQFANPLTGGVLDIQTTPTEFALLQNFPNPFNPETTIGYELAESADVTLQIYNVVGQVVRTLMTAEPQSVGRYQVRWDGMDDRGMPVSSGIYFYQISAGKFQDVRKLMLLK